MKVKSSKVLKLRWNDNGLSTLVSDKIVHKNDKWKNIKKKGGRSNYQLTSIVKCGTIEI